MGRRREGFIAITQFDKKNHRNSQKSIAFKLFPRVFRSVSVANMMSEVQRTGKHNPTPPPDEQRKIHMNTFSSFPPTHQKSFESQSSGASQSHPKSNQKIFTVNSKSTQSHSISHLNPFQKSQKIIPKVIQSYPRQSPNSSQQSPRAIPNLTQSHAKSNS